MLCIAWGPTWMILIMCCRVGILPLSIPARGFMLRATMIIVLSECKFYHKHSPKLANELAIVLCMIPFSLSIFFQWSWQCSSIWSVSPTAWHAEKSTVLVSSLLLLVLFQEVKLTPHPLLFGFELDNGIKYALLLRKKLLPFSSIYILQTVSFYVTSNDSHLP